MVERLAGKLLGCAGIALDQMSLSQKIFVGFFCLFVVGFFLMFYKFA